MAGVIFERAINAHHVFIQLKRMLLMQHVKSPRMKAEKSSFKTVTDKSVNVTLMGRRTLIRRKVKVYYGKYSFDNA